MWPAPVIGDREKYIGAFVIAVFSQKTAREQAQGQERYKREFEDLSHDQN